MAAFDQQVLDCEARLRDTATYWQVRNLVRPEVLAHLHNPKPSKRGDLTPPTAAEVARHISVVLRKTGGAALLRNEVLKVFDEMEREPPTDNSAPLVAVRPEPWLPIESGAQLKDLERTVRRWENRIRKRLNKLALEQNIPLCCVRKPKEAASAGSEGNSSAPAALVALKFLYDDKRLLDILSTIPSSNATASSSPIVGWGMIKLQLQTPSSIADLRRRFERLHPKHYVHYETAGDDKDALFEQIAKRAEQCSKQKDSALARRFLQTGVPISLRPALWERALGCDTGPSGSAYVQRLNARVHHLAMLTDDLVKVDVRTSVTNNDVYFVFEDVADEVLLAFQHDTEVARRCASVIGSLPCGLDRDGRPVATYPPSGVLPFRGMAHYIAPICFCYAQSSRVYHVFREIYIQHFCRLHHIGTHAEGILSLSIFFENLLQRLLPGVYHHMMQLQCAPLSVAFRWIIYAFVGYLPVEQVLLLWDRIIGFRSMLLLPIAALAMFVFRANAIMETSSKDEIVELFADPSKLLIVPLVQHLLFVFQPKFEPDG